MDPGRAGGLCPACLMAGASVPTEAGPGSPRSGSRAPELARVQAAFPQLEVVELLGEGGMGAVFKARQRHLDRWVALKVLPDALGSHPEFAERFNREGRTLARLNHPNIVVVYDFGQADGLYFLLMEYVDGVNLRQAMRAGRFTPSQALQVVPRICEALQYAHEEGVLHRDIKPENILLDSRGRVKIADFGIAKLLGEPSAALTLTSSGAAVGTPAYMAPEQLENPADVDHRADIYSLGVVFYELLTGELPLGRFAAPSEKTSLDPRLDAIVLRALAKERERRQQSAEEVRAEVASVEATPPLLRAAVAAPTRLNSGGPGSAPSLLIRPEWRPGLLLALFILLGYLLAHLPAAEIVAYVTAVVGLGPLFVLGPLAIVVVGGVLAKNAWAHREVLWKALGLESATGAADPNSAASLTLRWLRGTVLAVLAVLAFDVLLRVGGVSMHALGVLAAARGIGGWHESSLAGLLLVLGGVGTWMTERGKLEPTVPKRAPAWFWVAGVLFLGGGSLGFVSGSGRPLALEGLVGAGLVLVGISLLTRPREAWLVARGLTGTASLVLLGHALARGMGMMANSAGEWPTHRVLGLGGDVVLALICLLTWRRLRSATQGEAFGWRLKPAANADAAVLAGRASGVALRTLVGVAVVVLVFVDSQWREPWRTVVPLNPGMVAPGPVGKPRRRPTV